MYTTVSSWDERLICILSMRRRGGLECEDFKKSGIVDCLQKKVLEAEGREIHVVCVCM